MAILERGALRPLPVQPYGPRMAAWLPRMQRAMLFLNRFVAVPALRAGLGPFLSTPWTGSLMVLRTRGRRSGRWRDAPLGYVIRDGCVYCCAGFGRRTHWLRNLEADPRVELLLPGRCLSGQAEEVLDPDEVDAAMRSLLGSMSWIARPMLGDLSAASRETVLSTAAVLPLVRIRVTGLATGPWDPGGRGWMLTTGVSGLLLARWLRRRLREEQGR